MRPPGQVDDLFTGGRACLALLDRDADLPAPVRPGPSREEALDARQVSRGHFSGDAPVGASEDGGYDLRKPAPAVVKWEARYVGKPFHVRFVRGGVQWR